MEFYGLLGEHLSHSLSGEIQNFLYPLLRLNAAYKLIEIPPDDIALALSGMKVLQLKGLNVTIPYKQQVIPHLDHLSHEAKRIGAVNTVHREGKTLTGYNTDYYGFGSMLEDNKIEVSGKIAMVLGYGGVSKAILTYLLDHDIQTIYLVTRKKNQITEQFDPRIVLKDYGEIESLTGEILINCTPVGMYPATHQSPVDQQIVEHFTAVVDLIYNPKQTTLLQYAQLQNKVNCGGLDMLIYQALKAVEIWEGITIPSEISSILIKKFENTFNIESNE